MYEQLILESTILERKKKDEKEGKIIGSEEHIRGQHCDSKWNWKLNFKFKFISPSQKSHHSSFKLFDKNKTLQ